MKNPAHPGGFVRRQCVEPLGLTITTAAAALGVTRTRALTVATRLGGSSSYRFPPSIHTANVQGAAEEKR